MENDSLEKKPSDDTENIQEQPEQAKQPEQPDNPKTDEDVLSRMPEELKEETKYDAPLDEIQEKRRRLRKRKRTRPLTIFITVCVIFAILVSPIFAVKEFKTNVSENYTKEELLDLLGFKEGMNIFRARFSSGGKKLNENPYIEKGKIGITLPNTVIITVEERKVQGNIFRDNSYLYIDQHGRVLDIEENVKSSCPVFEGLDFDEYALGGVLSIKNKDALTNAVSISQLAEKYSLSGYVVYLDVSDEENITAKINSAEIILGPMARMDEKIRTLAAIMPNISPDAMGTLDLRDIDSQIVFKYLT